MIFKNRSEAGELLAERLSKYRGKKAVVLALPRGGVPVGYEIAKILKLALDIIPIRKIGHPLSPEFAIGAIDEHGHTIFDETETSRIDPALLEAEKKREGAEAKRRAILYRRGRPPLPLTGKIAILVDDGIATGLTMKLAVMAARKKDAKSIIIAVPVSPREAVTELEDMGADVVTLEPPEDFLGAVGEHYIEFDQVTDTAVISLLNAS
ncbi:phosphoribosyl transferase [Candidatus Kaiserbacteria bacterium]|nr:phosphoribosyl transferase [Candidatus Kaiserbacteria bacterium]